MNFRFSLCVCIPQMNRSENVKQVVYNTREAKQQKKTKNIAFDMQIRSKFAAVHPLCDWSKTKRFI